MANARFFSRFTLATWMALGCLLIGSLHAQEGGWETAEPNSETRSFVGDTSDELDIDETKLISDWTTADPLSASEESVLDQADDNWAEFEVSDEAKPEVVAELKAAATAAFPTPQPEQWQEPEDETTHIIADVTEDTLMEPEATLDNAPATPNGGDDEVAFWPFTSDEEETVDHAMEDKEEASDSGWFAVEEEKEQQEAVAKDDVELKEEMEQAVPNAARFIQENSAEQLADDEAVPEEELRAQPMEVPQELKFTRSNTLKPLPTREEIIQRLEERKKGEQPVLDIDGNYRLRVGDTIRISIYGELNTDRVLTIDAHGEISYLLVGRMQAAGFTFDEFRRNINAEMANNLQFALVNVVPVEFGGLSYTVLGQVRNPGKKALLGKTTVLDAIAAADGFAVGFFRSQTQDLADLNHAFLARRGEYVPVDFWRLVVLGDMKQNIELEDGDYIYIPSSLVRNIYVLGEVRLPANIGYLNSETLAGAIAKARGITRHADIYAYIVRGSLSNPKSMRVNLDDLQHGRIRDVVLQPGDIVYVPRRDTLLGEQIIFTALRSFVSGFFNVAGRETFVELEPDAADSDFGGSVFFP